jgi:hypothetical protein
MRKRLQLTAILVLLLMTTGFSLDKPNMNEWLAMNHCAASVKLMQHDYNFFNKPMSHKIFQTGEPGYNQELTFQEAIWQMNYQTVVPEDRPDALEVEFHFKLTKGTSP